MVSVRACLLTPITLALLALPGPAVAHDPPDVDGPQMFLSTIFPRGRLGIEVLPLTPELRAHFGVDPGVGILVSKVGVKSPAAEAGIEAGDVILAADGKPIRSPHELVQLVGRFPEAEQLRLELSRAGDKRELRVVPKGRPWLTAREGAQMFGRMMVTPIRELREQIRELEQRLRALEQKLGGEEPPEGTEQT